MVSEPLADLVSAAAFLRHVMPAIAADLGAIRTHVGSMDPEMVGMHASVERIEGQMVALNDRIGDLADRMADVERAVERLEPHVKDVNLAVRPLRRARARMRPQGEVEDARMRPQGEVEESRMRPQGEVEESGGAPQL